MTLTCFTQISAGNCGANRIPFEQSGVSGGGSGPGVAVAGGAATNCISYWPLSGGQALRLAATRWMGTSLCTWNGGSVREPLAAITISR